jgi:hypothetical protein
MAETTMTAVSSRPTAYGLCRMPSQKQSEPLAVSRRPMTERDLPKAKTPHDQESLQRTIAATDDQIDALVCKLYGLPEQEIRIVEGVLK